MPRAPKKRLTASDEASLRDRMLALAAAKDARLHTLRAWNGTEVGSAAFRDAREAFMRAENAEIGLLFELKGALGFLLKVET